MKVKIIRSKKRKRTANARLKNGILYVRVPTNLSLEKIKELVQKFKDVIEKRKKVERLTDNGQLEKRAKMLNQKYFSGNLKYHSIKWSANQKNIYGSCKADRETIRISIKLAGLPRWVLDAVLIHELAHLIVPGHSKQFWEIVNRYPLAERARGYLMALGFKWMESAN